MSELLNQLLPVAVGLVALLGSLWLHRDIGWVPLLSVGSILALATYPAYTLVGTQVGVASVIIAAIIALLSPVRHIAPLRFLPFLAFVAIAFLTSWRGSGTTVANVLPLVTAVLAWVVGRVAGSGVTRVRAVVARVSLDEVVAAAIIVAIVVQLIVAGDQMLFGVEQQSAPDSKAALESGRASGTFGHPGNLGKVIVLLVVMLLPILASERSRARKRAVIALALAFVPIGLSASRSNFLALIFVTLAWALLAPRARGISLRFALPLLAVIISIPFIDTIVERFSEDPAGGARDHFMSVALAHIGDNLWVGVGPGGYIDYFGRFDALTAAGWPVHNVFVLYTAELGLLGALALFIPLIILPLARAIVLFSAAETRQRAGARATLVLIGVVVMMGVTGWGLGYGSVLLLWFAASGFIDAYMTSTPKVEAAESEPLLLATAVGRRTETR